MGKTEFLASLQRAMTGLPPEQQAKTLAYYEQCFIDGMVAGRSEQETANELGDPRKIAMTLRASTHMHRFEEKKNPANLLRVIVSAVGLAVFNLFMVVPAMVYAALLAALYACALGFYVGGVAITASGLSGANELALAGPLRDLGAIMDLDVGDPQTKVTIGTHGVHISQDRPEAAEQHAMAAINAAAAARAGREAAAQAALAGREAAIHAAAAAREAGRAAGQAAGAAAEAAVAAAVAADATVLEQAESDAEQVAHDVADAVADVAEAAEAAEVAELDDNSRAALRSAAHQRAVRVVRRAEAVAENGIQVTTELDPGSHATQTVFGLCMVLVGIILFLLSLVATKYTMIGVKRYIEMNFSLLKGS